MLCTLHSKRWLYIPFISASLMISSCSFMPSTGPRASRIKHESKHHKAPPVVPVTAQLAAEMARNVDIKEQERDNALVHSLSGPIVANHKIGVGDQLTITIWSQGGDGESAAIGTSALQPSPHKFGTYGVNYKGNVDLPYVGWVHLAGLTYIQGEQKVHRALEATALFESASVSIQPKTTHGQNIVVVGAVHKPTILNWNEGGIDLIEAITQAGGYELGAPLQGTDMGLNILLARKGSEYNIPLRLAIGNHIPLHPGDRVALQHKPNVRVLALGAGWSKPAMVPFYQTPTLSQVMAAANGLNMASAQGKSVFILKKNQSVIYLVDFDKTDGMEASQIFPVEDGDMVYVPMTRSVTLQQIMSMMLTIAYPGMYAAAFR